MPEHGQHVNRIEVFLVPVIRNGLFLPGCFFGDLIDQLWQIAVGPGGVDRCTVVLVEQQLVCHRLGVISAKVDIDRQPQLDCSRTDGQQRTQVTIGLIVITFLDMTAGVGSEDEIGIAELSGQQRGQGNGSVQPLAIELSEPHSGLFSMTKENQGLRSVFCLRLRAHGKPENSRNDQ